MRNITKKWIIITVAAVTAFGVLTACTKTTEKKDDTEEAGDVAQSEDTDSEGAQTAEDTDMQEAGPESGSEGADSGEETELNGLIAEVPEDSDDSFIIEKLVVEQENGVDIMGTDPDGTKITIVYSDETNFVKRTVQDGGDNTEEKEGSAADLQEGFTVEARGSYGGDNVFFATDVKIVEVIL